MNCKGVLRGHCPLQFYCKPLEFVALSTGQSKAYAAGFTGIYRRPTTNYERLTLTSVRASFGIIFLVWLFKNQTLRFWRHWHWSISLSNNVKVFAPLPTWNSVNFVFFSAPKGYFWAFYTFQAFVRLSHISLTALLLSKSAFWARFVPTSKSYFLGVFHPLFYASDLPPCQDYPVFAQVTQAQ